MQLVIVSAGSLSPHATDTLLRRVLSLTEQPRYFALPPRRRADWLAGRVALKRAYLRWTALPGPRLAREVEVINGAAGVPRIADDDRARCSIAHAGGWAVAAVDDAEVGVDVERAQRVGAALCARIAAPVEVARVRAGGWPASLVPTLVWTLKEATLKATGLGLAIHPRHAIIATPPNPCCIVQIAYRARAVSEWRAAAYVRGGFCFAVARPGWRM